MREIRELVGQLGGYDSVTCVGCQKSAPCTPGSTNVGQIETETDFTFIAMEGTAVWMCPDCVTKITPAVRAILVVFMNGIEHPGDISFAGLYDGITKRMQRKRGAPA